MYYPTNDAGCFTQANENVFMAQFKFSIGHNFVASCVLEEEMEERDCIICPNKYS